MGAYTRKQLEQLQTISLVEEEGDLQPFLQVMKTFRTFPEALADFCTERGVLTEEIWRCRTPGSALDENQRNAFQKVLRERFAEQGMKLPRDVLSRSHGIRRENAWAFCFALHLEEPEAEEFLTHVALQPPVYAGSWEDVIAQAGLRLHLSWQQVHSRMQQVHSRMQQVHSRMQQVHVLQSETESEPGLCRKNGMIPGTRTLQVLEQKITSLEELDAFLEDYRPALHRQYQTCREDLQDMWQEVQAWASQEAQQIANEFDEVPLLGPTRSIWQIYLQILGREYALCKGHLNRSFLKDLEQLPLPYAFVKQFPDRQKIEKLFAPASGSAQPAMRADSLRKLMIFLFFYKYWVQEELEPGGGYSKRDLSRMFEAELNRHLEESGLAPLYAGHPYDWMFLSLSMEDDPLQDFRTLFSWMLQENQPENGPDRMKV